jgi:diguanylate cyclase (GGDEF)-like protein
MRQSILNIKRNYRLLLIAFCVVVTAGIGIFDYHTGIEVPLSIFYLIPISLAAWFTGMQVGLWFCLISTGSYFISHFIWDYTYSQPLILYVNTIARFLFFTVFVLIISGIRTILAREVEMARTDQLTGVANRRYFYERAEMVMEHSRRYGGVLSLVYIDIDNFKAINDLWGHQEGDQRLAALAETIKNTIRKTDIVARLGGDEFVILLPEATKKQASAVVTKLQNKLITYYGKKVQPMYLSIGVVTFHAIPDTVDQLVGASDRLMYNVKVNGKNSVVFAEE